MNLKAALAKVFGLAAILATLAFAPSAAQAHVGRAHVGQAHGQHGHTARVVVTVQLPVLTLSIDKLSKLPGQILQDQALHDHDAAELRSAPLVLPAADNAICIQSCCAGAPCHSSAACTLGHDLSVVLPPGAGLSLHAWGAPGIAGHDPEGIRKPPKTFA